MGAEEWVPVEAEIDIREMRISARASGKSHEMRKTVEAWRAMGYRVMVVGASGAKVLEPYGSKGDDDGDGLTVGG